MNFQLGHFESVHTILVKFIYIIIYNLTLLGLTVVGLGLSQPVLGIIADKWFHPATSKNPIFPDRIHWLVGYGNQLLKIYV